MKKFLLPAFLTISVFFVFSKSSFASVSTNIDVSNNGANSKNSVNVENNTGGKTSTNIKIETNGEVKTYNSENGEDVNIESEDGSVKVKINNNGSSTSGNTGNIISENSKKIEEKKALIDTQIKARKEEIEKRKQEVLAKAEKPSFNFGSFLSAQLEFIKNFFSFWSK